MHSRLDSSLMPRLFGEKRLRLRLLAPLLSLSLVACGGGGDGSAPPTGSPPQAPQITSLTSDRTQYFLGDAPQVTAVFSGGTGRIVFVDRPGEPLSVASGQPVSLPALTQSRELKLIVQSTTAQTAERSLTLPVQLRGRYTPLPDRLAATGHATVNLPNGDVLVAGGSRGEGVLSAAINVFSRQSQRFSRVGSMLTGREGNVLSLLPDGNVLSTGGQYALMGAPQNEIINPATGATTPAAPMSTRRVEHAALVLDSGRVLVTGGVSTEGVRDGISQSAEIYDPATRTFRRLAAHMTTPRANHEMHLLANGKVLIVGGFSYEGIGTAYGFAEVFDPATETFTAIPSPVTLPRALFAAERLRDGSVLIAGGESADGVPSSEILRYDPTTNRIERLPVALPVPTTLSRSALLPDRRLGVFGGLTMAAPFGSTATYAVGGSPVSANRLPDLPDNRVFHRVLKFSDGRLMIVGGANGLAFRDTVYILD